jgi:hypothetical protein
MRSGWKDKTAEQNSSPHSQETQRKSDRKWNSGFSFYNINRNSMKWKKKGSIKTIKNLI